MTKIPAIELIDFYDYEKLDKLHESRAKKWLKLFLKASKDDSKAKAAIKKHEAEDRELKRRSSATGYYWT